MSELKDRAATGHVRELVVLSAPRSVPLVRRFAVDACAELGWGQVAGTVELLVAEVATNAVLHADGPQLAVRIVDGGRALRVEVDDSSTEVPAPRHAGAGAEDGRGLLLVEALASDHGVRAREGGKTVWFDVRGEARRGGG